MCPRREIEFEISSRRLVAAGVALVVIAAALAYALLRVRHVPESGQGAAAARGAAAVEALGRKATLFDREGEGGAEPDPSRQVTASGGRESRFELDLGTAATRAEADALQKAAEAAGCRALVALDPSGRYKVVGGPYPREPEARAAAARVAARLGREVPVRAR